MKTQLQDQLDSVVYVDPLGNNINKMTFIFTKNFWSHREIHELWNDELKDWQIFEEFILDWNDDGYLRSYTFLYPMYGEGMKQEYTYNAQNLGDSETISYLAGDEWINEKKHTYKYDDRGNITEFQRFYYNDITSSWRNDVKEIAAYDEVNQQTLWESYDWIGSDWVGVGKEEYEWYMPGSDLSTLIFAYQWNIATKDWEYYLKRENEYENGKPMLNLLLFWNKAREDWSGEVIDPWNEERLMLNDKTDYIYDENGREISQIASSYANGVWTPAFGFETEWSTADNGETQSLRNGYLYSSATEREHTQILRTQYCPFYSIYDVFYTYIKETQKNDKGVWQDFYEEFYQYDDAGRILEGIIYTFDNNVKLADFSMTYQYDDANNSIQAMTYHGLGADTWVLDGKAIYEYANNIETRKYVYSGEELVPDEGKGVDYDFNVPASELITFIGNDDPYKILYLYEYSGNGIDFDTSKRIFYYSQHDITGLTEKIGNNGISLYPNPVTDLLSIHSPNNVQVTIYGLNGVKLMQTSDKQINVSALAPGLYIVDVNGVKTKVVKK